MQSFVPAMLALCLGSSARDGSGRAMLSSRRGRPPRPTASDFPCHEGPSLCPAAAAQLQERLDQRRSPASLGTWLRGDIPTGTQRLRGGLGVERGVGAMLLSPLQREKVPNHLPPAEQSPGLRPRSTSTVQTLPSVPCPRVGMGAKSQGG